MNRTPRPSWLPQILLIVAGALAYADSFDGVFVFDDRMEIRGNPAIRSLWRPIEAMFGGPGLPRRPLPYLSFAINYALGGLDVSGYHVVNLAIHLAAAVVLYDIVRTTLAGPRLADRFGASAAPVALAVALVWVVHPLTTQAVTYIYQRMESMMSLFYLLTLACFMHGATASRQAPWLAASVACCAAGMACKEVMVTAPLLVLWYDRVFIGTRWRGTPGDRLRFHAALASTWLVLVAVVRSQAARYGELEKPQHSALSYALNQSAVILHYLRLVCLPRGLCLDYGWQERPLTQLIVPLAAIAALLMVVCWCVARRPAAGFLGGAFFLILAPSSSILPVDELAFEHRMYLPLAVVLTTLVLAADALLMGLARRWPQWRRGFHAVGVAAVAILAVTLAAMTWARNADYRSLVAMWQDVAAKAPRNAKAYENLGLALAEAGRLEESVAAFRQAIALGAAPPPAPPDWLAKVHGNLGASLIGLGRLDDAAAEYDEAVRLAPADYLTQVNRGIVAARRGDATLARQSFETAIELKPDDAPAYVNLGLVMEPVDPDAALRLFGRAVSLNPDYAPALAALGRCHLRRGRRSRAIEYLQQAVRLDPTLVAARRDLSEALAMPAASVPQPLPVANP